MYGFKKLIELQQNTLLFVVLLASNSTFNLIRSTCNAQETPTLTLEYFNYSTSYRQNVCQRQLQLDNNETLQLRDALAGLELSTWLYLDNRYVKFDPTTKALNPLDPGLIAVLLDELADRAGFKWRNSFGVIEDIALPKDKTYTYTDLLLWSVSSYDLSAAYWQKTLERMQQGASFPDGWYDASTIMIAVEEEEQGGANNLDLWGFLSPFSTGVWVMILVTIVVSALAYWFLDWYDTASDKMSLDHEPAENLFLAAMTFTGNFEFQPSSNPARIFAVSMAFLSLIVMSSYTANLASFLVVRNTPSIQINTLDDAMKSNYRICLIAGSTADEFLTRFHPRARIVRTETEKETYSQLQEGKCDIAIASVSSWNEFRTDRSVNGDCRLTWIGRSIQNQDGGFATKSDSGSLCTSLIRDVLNLHMVEMKSDGFVERAWDDHLRKKATVDCDAAAMSTTYDESSSSDGSSSTQLSLQAMGGAFIVHYILSAFAIFLAVFMKVYGKKSLCKKKPSDESEPVTVSNQRLEARETWQNSEDENDGPAPTHTNGSGLNNNNNDDSFTQGQVQEMNAKLAALAQQYERLSLQNAEILERLHALVSA